MTQNQQAILQLEFMRDNHFLNMQELKSIETSIELLKKNIGGVFDKELNDNKKIIEYKCIGAANPITFEEIIKTQTDRMQEDGLDVEVQFRYHDGNSKALLIGRK